MTKSDGSISKDPTEIANILNNQFASVFVDDSNVPLHPFEPRTNQVLSSLDITRDMVFNMLIKLDHNKSKV